MLRSSYYGGKWSFYHVAARTVPEEAMNRGDVVLVDWKRSQMKRLLAPSSCTDFAGTSISRRFLLKAGGLGLLGLHLPAFLQAKEKSPNRKARARAVIFLHQFGGPSQT